MPVSKGAQAFLVTVQCVGSPPWRTSLWQCLLVAQRHGSTARLSSSAQRAASRQAHELLLISSAATSRTAMLEGLSCYPCRWHSFKRTNLFFGMSTDLQICLLLVFRFCSLCSCKLLGLRSGCDRHNTLGCAVPASQSGEPSVSDSQTACCVLQRLAPSKPFETFSQPHGRQ